MVFPRLIRVHWFNIVQSELLNIVRAAGLDPDKMTQTQILDALKKLFLQRQDPFGDINADGAEAVATALANLGLGSAATRDVGTGPGQIPDMSRFSASLTGTFWDKASQWQKLPSGLLLQWGVADSESADSKNRVTVAFPLNFSRAPFGIYTSSFNGSFLRLAIGAPGAGGFWFSYEPLPPDAPYTSASIFWLALGVS